MPIELDIADLMERAKSGDEAAVREFLNRFEPEVRTMVRGRLPRSLRPKFDSMDFVQAVWQSFFTDLRKGTREFENSKHLRGFLAGVARNKVFAEHRRLTKTEKHALAQEERLYTRRGTREAARDVVSPDPSPSQAVQARDRLAQLTAGCSPREVQVIVLRHQGLTFEEIAARTGVNERTVRRIIDGARADGDHGMAMISGQTLPTALPDGEVPVDHLIPEDSSAANDQKWRRILCAGPASRSSALSATQRGWTRLPVG